jgi:hypothetical protein
MCLRTRPFASHIPPRAASASEPKDPHQRDTRTGRNMQLDAEYAAGCQAPRIKILSPESGQVGLSREYAFQTQTQTQTQFNLTCQTLTQTQTQFNFNVSLDSKTQTQNSV